MPPFFKLELQIVIASIGVSTPRNSFVPSCSTLILSKTSCFCIGISAPGNTNGSKYRYQSEWKNLPGFFQIDVPESHVSDPGNMLVAFLHHHPFDPIQNFCPSVCVGRVSEMYSFPSGLPFGIIPSTPVDPAIRHHGICILDFHAFVPIDPATGQYPAKKNQPTLVTAEIIAVFNQSVLNPAQFRGLRWHSHVHSGQWRRQRFQSPHWRW